MLCFRRASGKATQEVFNTLPTLFPPKLLASRSMLLEVTATSELSTGTLQGKHILVTSLLNSEEAVPTSPKDHDP